MIISNNALKLFDTLPSDLIIRINVAWCKSIEELTTIVENATHPIYLDYPTGRSKPPKPTILLSEVVQLVNSNKYRVRHFAFSNAEDPTEIEELRKKIVYGVKLVPKIETIKGVDNLVAICKAANTDMVMLDHEDLYVNVNHDSETYNSYMEKVLNVGKEHNIKIYKVQGIIFDEAK